VTGVLPAALVLYLLLLGRSRDRAARRAARTAALVLALVALGYGAVHVITPADLVWQVVALDRLLLQLWPSALFAFFLYAANPAELDQTTRTRKRSR